MLAERHSAIDLVRPREEADLVLAAALAAPAVDIVVPVHNEASQLAASICRLYGYLTETFPFSFRVTIADNGSTDGTWMIADALAEHLMHLRVVKLTEKGRGRALHAAWSKSDADVLAYMDVDLSTDLSALLPLVAPLLSGHSDLAIGSRLTNGSRVVRGSKRELISRGYNAILHGVLGVRFTDAQCGFKAIRADRAQELLPFVEDQAWFFDTELLVLAERAGLRIHEVPVDWIDDSDSRVEIVATAKADLRGVFRLARDVRSRRIPLAELSSPAGVPPSFGAQVGRFVAIGIASTVAYLALFVLLRTALSAQNANALALLVTAVANTAANRRLTFAIRGSTHALRHQAQGLIVFGLALGITSSSLAVLHASVAQPSRALELGVLIPANLLATVLRFALLRAWVFRARRTAPANR